MDFFQYSTKIPQLQAVQRNFTNRQKSLHKNFIQQNSQKRLPSIDKFGITGYYLKCIRESMRVIGKEVKSYECKLLYQSAFL